MDERAARLVVVGASAGGVEAITTLAAGLPEDLGAAVCVVLHLRADSESRLAHIISRAGPLPAMQVRGEEELRAGRIYVGPPDRHLVVDVGHVAATDGPRVNGFRPSIDVLFGSAAAAYGEDAIAVVLSGMRDDGVAGATEVGERGGCVLVQDPAEAKFAALPALTVDRDEPDHVLPLAELAPRIAALAMRENVEGDVPQR